MALPQFSHPRGYYQLGEINRDTGRVTGSSLPTWETGPAFGSSSEIQSAAQRERDQAMLSSQNRFSGNPNLFGWNPFGGGARAGSIPALSPYEPKVLSQTKDPELETFISSILDRIGSSNPNQLHREARSPQVEAYLRSAFGNYGKDTANSRAGLAQFMQQYLGAGDEIRGVVDQEGAAMSRVYGGADDPNSLIGTLNRLADERRLADATLSQRATNAVAKSGKLARLAGGNGSYVDKQIMDTAAGIAAEEARQQADLRRENELQVVNAQGQFQGRRQSSLEALASRGAFPLQLAQQLQSGEIANLSGLAGIDMSNILLEREGDRLARELGLLGGVRELRASNRFEGLEQEAEPDWSGLNPVPLPGVQPQFDMASLLSLLNVGGANVQGGSPNLRSTDGQSMGNESIRYLLDALKGGQTTPQIANRSMYGVNVTPEIARAYKIQKGVDPFSDQNVSPELLRRIHNTFSAANAGRTPIAGVNYSNEYLQNYFA